MTISEFVETYVKDEYMMEVLFFNIKGILIQNDLSLKGIQHVEIGECYIQEPIYINLNDAFPDQESSLALLLSLRALVVDDELIDCNIGQRLIFTDEETPKHYWILLTSLIKELYQKDEDFAVIFDLLEDIYVYGKMEEEHLEKFKQSLKQPKLKNIGAIADKVIKRMKVLKADPSAAIATNAFVGNDDLTQFTADEHVIYIGDTAFSFCSSLKEIQIKAKEVTFGVFPIVECNALERIIVPRGTKLYYKSKLPYYKDIIVEDEAEDVADDSYRAEDSTEVMVVHEPDLNERRLERLHELFKHVTTSYKYLWFLAILSFAKEGKKEILMNEMLAKMTGISWPLIMTKGLDFGQTDSLKKYIYQLIIVGKIATSNTSAKQAQSAILKSEYAQKVLKPLLSNVPYRFLSPWIKFESNHDTMAKSKDAAVDALYTLTTDRIIINDSWLDYLTTDFDKIKAFTVGAFLEYLQKHNKKLKDITVVL